jgi:aspartate beta-hydroxylase
MTDDAALLRAAGAGPVHEAGYRVVDALRNGGADDRALERARRWSALLSARLRGAASIQPADPLQRPTVLYLDGFEDRAWHDPAHHPVLATIEENAAAIRAEFVGRTTAAEQWPEYHEAVAEDKKWRACWFYRYGLRVAETAALYPRTAALLDAHSGPEGPLASALGDVFLSRLEAGGRIPAHNGICNISLVGHLALVVPPGCRFRVGAETRGWQEGRCLVFDDTFEHEAWNDSARDRYVLVFALWQHGVAPVERAFIRVLTRWLHTLSAGPAAG